MRKWILHARTPRKILQDQPRDFGPKKPFAKFAKLCLLPEGGLAIGISSQETKTLVIYSNLVTISIQIVTIFE